MEVVLFRDDYNFGQFNMPLVLCIILIWGVLWLSLIIEHLKHGKVRLQTDIILHFGTNLGT